MNPYVGTGFFSFLGLFFHRMFLLLTGKLPIDQIASDEIQVFVLVLLGISCSMIGAFLIAKQMTMLANALSHTILIGIVIAFLLLKLFVAGSESMSMPIDLNILIIASIITGFLTNLLTSFVHKNLKLQKDASIAFVFTTLFALGILLVTLYTKNLHLGIEAIMGNVDALHLHDVKLMLYLSFFNIIVFVFAYKRFYISTFDPSLSKGLGISNSFINHFLMVQTAAVAIGGFRAVGVILFLSLLVGPILIAKHFTKSFHKIIAISMMVMTVFSLVAVAITRSLLSWYNMPLSTSGMLISLLLIMYLILMFVNSKKSPLVVS